MKISENIKNGPKNLKNVSSENQGKNKELPAVGKSQRSLYDHIACIFPIFSFLAKTLSFLLRDDNIFARNENIKKNMQADHNLNGL